MLTNLRYVMLLGLLALAACKDAHGASGPTPIGKIDVYPGIEVSSLIGKISDDYPVAAFSVEGEKERRDFRSFVKKWNAENGGRIFAVYAGSDWGGCDDMECTVIPQIHLPPFFPGGGSPPVANVELFQRELAELTGQ